MTDLQLRSKLKYHRKRALEILQEIDALITTGQATWPEIALITGEVNGHLGRIIAICNVAGARELAVFRETEPTQHLKTK